MSCPRWEWRVIGLVLLVQQALSQGIRQLEDNPVIAVGSNISLQVTASVAGLAKGQWYLSTNQVLLVPDNQRTMYSVSGVFHRLTIIDVQESDRGRYYYLYGQGILKEGNVQVTTTVDGGISQWSPWIGPPCPVSCGQGVRNLTRSRTCTQPAPQNGGQNCTETRLETSQRVCSLGNCPSCPAAIVYFVVDGSESVTSESFQLAKDALRSFVSSTISRNGSMQVGVVVFSSNVTDVINASSSISGLQSSINSLSRPSSGTSTHLGIRRATLLLNQDTSGIPKVMIVVTDGLSNLPEQTQAAAAEAKDSGITMFAVGVNYGITLPSFVQRFQAEITSIASSVSTAIQITSYDFVNNSLNGITEAICRGAVNGLWSNWGPWSDTQCPDICGQNTLGNSTRRRTCSNPAPLFNGLPCVGSSAETIRRGCAFEPCPIHGAFGPWDVWQISPCPVSCGTSATTQRSRRRQCNNPAPQFGGRNCTGAFTMTEQISCNLTACPDVLMLTSNPETYIRATITLQVSLPGQTQRGVWNKLSGSVFSTLTDTPRTDISVEGDIHKLTINDVTAEDAGTYIYTVIGQSIQGLLTVRTPIDGGISLWSQWSDPACPVSCGQGFRNLTRSRTCTQPVPQFGGQNCTETRQETSRRVCSLGNCPINGAWTMWSQWDIPPCSRACGNYSRLVTRFRTCTNPRPQHSGDVCFGQSEQTETRSCNLPSCSGCAAAIVYFVVDGSESVSSEKFQLAKDALRSFVSSTISRNGSMQVGVVVFSSNVTGVINASSSISGLQSSINSLSRPIGGTSTHLGIRRGTLLLNQDTSGIPKVMIVITDGMSNYPSQTQASAAEAKNSGITMFAVGVSDFTSPIFVQRFQAEILSIASSNATAVRITNFNDLITSVNGITERVCQGAVDGGWSLWNVWSAPQCNATCGSGVLGRVSRRRTCTNPVPSFGGRPCQGFANETAMRTCGLPRCPDEIRGRFSQWTTWVTSPCSATCGRNVTRTLTRRRFCNSPAPANGGPDCTGPRNDTMIQICTVPECLVAAVCDDVRRYYGVGYRYHPTDCEKYIQCYYNPNGKAIGVYRNCPFGYFWDQESLRCIESWRVSCPLERCKGTCGSSYKMSGSCRSYWKCVNGKSEAKCCPRGLSFSPGDGCLPNYTCNDLCPSAYVSRDVCDKHPNWNNARTYNISFGNLGWRSTSCPENTYFNLLDCQCTAYCTETCAASYTFVAGTRPSWMVLERVSNQAGALSLTNASKVHLDVKMTVADSPIMFNFTYRDAVVANESRVLASSKNRLVVSTDPKGVIFSITSWYGEVTRMMLSTDGMPRGQWRTVSVMYTGKYLIGSVMNDNVKVIDRVMIENTNLLSDGLTIGSDASNKPGKPFVGDIGSVSVYKCDPGIMT